MSAVFAPSPEQQQVIAHRGGHLQVIACAGAGKTEAISHRVSALIEEGVEPAQIVAFTFTERAALGLKNRITRRVAQSKGEVFLDRLSPMFIGTIHAPRPPAPALRLPGLRARVEWTAERISSAAKREALSRAWFVICQLVRVHGPRVTAVQASRGEAVLELFWAASGQKAILCFKRQIPDSEGANCCTHFSRAGRQNFGEEDNLQRMGRPLQDTLPVKDVIRRARPPDTVWSLAFSPDGKQLASGSRDKTVRLWDVTTGQETACLGHDDWVHCVAFSPDGRTLAAGGRRRP